ARRLALLPADGAGRLSAARLRRRRADRPALPVLGPHRAGRQARLVRPLVLRAEQPPRPPRRQRSLPRPQLRWRLHRLGSSVRHLRRRRARRAVRLRHPRAVAQLEPGVGEPAGLRRPRARRVARRAVGRQAARVVEAAGLAGGRRRGALAEAAVRHRRVRALRSVAVARAPALGARALRRAARGDARLPLARPSARLCRGHRRRGADRRCALGGRAAVRRRAVCRGGDAHRDASTVDAVNDDRLPPSLLAALAARGNSRSFRAQTILLNEGDAGGSLYIVLSGRLRVYASSPEGRDVILSEHGPGEYVGELSLDGTPRSASVKAVEATTCCVVAAAQVPEFLAEHPEFALHLTQKLTRMVRRLTEQVKSLALQDVYGRMVRLLMELSEPVGDERVVREKLTQQ